MAKPNRIGVDASWLRPLGAGIQQYTVNLLAAYAAAFPDDSLTLCNAPELPAALAGCAQRNVPHGPSLPLRLLHNRLLMPLVARQFDWFIAPNFVTFSSLPASCRLALLIPDLAYRRYPELCDAAHAAILREQVPRCLARAALVLTISPTVVTEIRNAYPDYHGEVRMVEPAMTVPPAADDDRGIVTKLGLDGMPFLLGVGTREPRKDWPLAVAGFAEYRRRSGRAVKLVIAGSEGWGGAEHRQPTGDGVLLAGAVSEAEKWALYRAAHGYLTTSVYEGYGMPLAEALATGLPAAATDCGGSSAMPAPGLVRIAARSASAVADALLALDALERPCPPPTVSIWPMAAQELHDALHHR